MFHHRFLTVFSEYFLGSEYASSFKHARVLNIPFPKFKRNVFKENIKSSISWKLEMLFFRKLKKLFQSRSSGKTFEGWGGKVHQVAAYYTTFIILS